MDPEPPFRLVDTDCAREKALQLFDGVRRLLRTVLPPEADVRHIGSTAIPGCLTKGDLDIVVRVPANGFGAADAALAALFRRNLGSVRTDTFSAFEDPTARPHLGVQLVAIDSPSDFFHVFVEVLQRSPELVEAYGALKQRYDGADMATYRAAKDSFIERVLAAGTSDR